jgi:uncharacterized protein (TIGR00369 family)
MGYEHCFVCGQENEKGLGIRFQRQGEEGVFATFQPDRHHEGWPGIQHGGVTSAILDEAMAYVTYYMGFVALTAEMRVLFKEPIRIGEPIAISAFPVRKSRRIVEVEARICDLDGQLKAKAVAKMMVLSGRQREALGLENLE